MMAMKCCICEQLSLIELYGGKESMAFAPVFYIVTGLIIEVLLSYPSLCHCVMYLTRMKINRMTYFSLNLDAHSEKHCLAWLHE